MMKYDSNVPEFSCCFKNNYKNATRRKNHNQHNTSNGNRVRLTSFLRLRQWNSIRIIHPTKKASPRSMRHRQKIPPRTWLHESSKIIFKSSNDILIHLEEQPPHERFQRRNDINDEVNHPTLILQFKSLLLQDVKLDHGHHNHQSSLAVLPRQRQKSI